MKNFLIKLDVVIEKALRIFNCLMIAGIVALIFVEVLARYFFSNSIVWADEALRFALIWITFLSLMNIARDNKHLRMEMFYKKMPPKIQLTMNVVGISLCIAMSALFCVVGMQYSNKFADSSSPLLGISYKFVYICMPIGFFTFAYQQVIDLVRCIKIAVRKEK